VPAKFKINNKECDAQVPRRNRPSKGTDDATALPDPSQSRSSNNSSPKDVLPPPRATHYELLTEPRGMLRLIQKRTMGTLKDHKSKARSEPWRAPLTAFEADEPASGAIAGIKEPEQMGCDTQHSPPPSFIQESPISREFTNPKSKSNQDSIIDDFIHSRKVMGDKEMGELVSSMSAYDPFPRK
jgi:hypothetical protein